MRALLVLLLVAGTASAQPKDPACLCRERRAKIIAASAVGGVHLAYATWSYFAWYKDAPAGSFKFEAEPNGGLSFREYAGGADKLGHFWVNHAMTRIETAVLVAGGFPRFESSLVAAGLTSIAFQLTEIQDGYYPYGYSWRDSVANFAGAGFAILLENVPSVDRLLDFKIQYFPSKDYRNQFRENGSVDIGQDYTGQTYLLALHPSAIYDSPWTRFIDLSLGFQTRNYSPKSQAMLPREQTEFVALSINFQALLNELLPDSRLRRVGRGIFEVYQPPYTALHLYDYTRSPE